MQTLADIKLRVSGMDGGGRICKCKEINALPGILKPDEPIERVVLGTGRAGKSILLVATDRRMILVGDSIYQIKPEDLTYDRITAIDGKAGLLLAKIIVRAPGVEAEVLNLDKVQARTFTTYIQHKVASVYAQSAQNAAVSLLETKSPVTAASGSHAADSLVIPSTSPKPLTPSERWCPHCGKRCGTHANFCEHCGTGLSSEEAKVKVAPPPVVPIPVQVNIRAMKSGDVNIWRLIAHHEFPMEAAEWSRREGVIAIGWGGAGDLRLHNSSSETVMTRLVADAHPGSSVSNYVHGGRSLWRLYQEVKPGDLVIVSAAGTRVLTMRVTGDYYFVGGEYPIYYEHRRRAEVVPVDPNVLWRTSGGPAPGENVRWTLFRCSRTLSEAEIYGLLG